MKTIHSTLAGTAVAWVMIGCQALQAASFVGLGDLPGGPYQSFVRDVSADGSVVVGTSRVADFTNSAFRWTPATGMVAMAPGGTFSAVSDAHGVSDDGSVVVGDGRSAGNPEGFRWTQAGGFVGLGDLPGGGPPHSEALAVSGGRFGGRWRGAPRKPLLPRSWASAGACFPLVRGNHDRSRKHTR